MIVAAAAAGVAATLRRLEGEVHQGRVPGGRLGNRRDAEHRFFFQAEDGIRDCKVTGVQTCALPISEEESAMIQRHAGAVEGLPRLLLRIEGAALALAAVYMFHRIGANWWWFALILMPDVSLFAYFQIGRASCRERV